MIVAAIVAVVAAVAAPRWSNAQQNYRVDLAARRIAADLDAARVAARTESKSKTVTFVEATRRYTLGNVRLARGVDPNTTVDLRLDPHRITSLAVDFGGVKTVTFDAFGRPSSGGQVTIASGTASRKIALDADSGRTAVSR